MPNFDLLPRDHSQNKPCEGNERPYWGDQTPRIPSAIVCGDGSGSVPTTMMWDAWRATS